MRNFRMVVGGAVALVLVACAPGAGNQTLAPSQPTTATLSPGAASAQPSLAANSLASALVFGGPPECPERPFCLIGLRETYGLEFAEFRPLDAGGPITVEALANGDIDVALLFSSDPTIPARNFVVLEDDRGLQRADNIVPVVNAQLVADFPVVADLLNPISERLTQEVLVELNRQSTEDREDPGDIAAAWLESQNLLDAADPAAGAEAEPITVGKTNFYEQDILAELYARVLEANGFQVNRQEASGTREVVFPALEDGQIDILPEYAATALEFVNGGAGQATADAEETAELLRQALAPLGLTALDPAPATDQNVIVVTQELADQYDLSTISDLAEPAP